MVYTERIKTVRRVVFFKRMNNHDISKPALVLFVVLCGEGLWPVRGTFVEMVVIINCCNFAIR